MTMNYNLIEVYIIEKNSTYMNDKIIDIECSYNTIENILLQMESNKIKSNKKELKIYKHNNLIYENNNNEKTNIYEIIPVNVSISEETFYDIVEIRYLKKKIKIHSFPFNKNIDDMYTINTIQYKLSDVYLNVETEIRNDKSINKAYFTANVESKDCRESIDSRIKKVLELLNC